MKKNKDYLQRFVGGISLYVALFTPINSSAQVVVDTTRTYRIGEVVVTGSNNATGRNLLPYTVSTIGSPNWKLRGSHNCFPPYPSKYRVCSFLNATSSDSV